MGDTLNIANPPTFLASLSLLDADRLRVLLALCRGTLEAKLGNIVECGSYRGGTAALMATLLTEVNSKAQLFLLDTWPTSKSSPPQLDTSPQREDFDDVSAEDVVSLLELVGATEQVRILPGWFEHTLPQIEAPIGLAHVDCTHYLGVSLCLEQLQEKLADDCLIVIDDVGDSEQRRFPGVKQAVDEFLKQNSDWKHSSTYGKQDHALVLYRGHVASKIVDNALI